MGRRQGRVAPRRPAASAGRPWAWLLAVQVLLLAPFAGFLAEEVYLDPVPESFMAAGALAAIGAVLWALLLGAPSLVRACLISVIAVWFVDLRFGWFAWWGLGMVACLALGALAVWLLRRHVTRLLAALAGIAVLVVLAQAHSGDGSRLLDARSFNESVPRPDLPVFVHLVLSEQIGLEGLPDGITGAAELEGWLRSFYLERGFRISGGAFNEHDDARFALAHMFNLMFGRFDPALVEWPRAGSEDVIIGRNRFFRWISDQGYAPRIFQMRYIDVCSPQALESAVCETYSSTKLGWLKDVAMPALDKARILLAKYWLGSVLYSEVRALYGDVRHVLDREGRWLPAWTWERYRLGPIPAAFILERLTAEISRESGGRYYFAHLSTPHSPFLQEPSCRIRPASDWLHRLDEREPARYPNTAGSRERRYLGYFAQVRCLHESLGAVLRRLKDLGLYDDAIILIHGDTGSRIYEVRPRFAARSEMSPSDYADSYSVLFALKAPGLEPGYDPRLRPAADLLRGLVSEGFRAWPEPAEKAGAPTVFMPAGSTGRRAPHGLMDFR